MRTKLFFSLFALVSFTSQTQAQSFQWVQQYGGVGEEYAFSIAVDDSSNSYVTGYIDANNSIRQNSIGCINHDIFIAKYDKSGVLIWIDQIGGRADDIGWGITVDKNHNVYIAASFQDTLNLTTDTLICSGYKDILVAKFNSSGVLQWAKQAGGTFANYGYAVACDSQNNIYVTGSFYGTVLFDTITLTSYGFNDCFLAKYDTLGNTQWAINDGGSAAGIDESYGICVDKNDNIYTCGTFSDTAYFATDTLISRGISDCFITKHDSSGNMLWIRQSGGSGTDMAQGLSADKYGNICVTGSFESTDYFDSDSLLSAGGSDVFISKYDPSGNFKWAKHAGGISTDQGAGISTDKNGRNYLTGFFSGNANFGSSSILSDGSADIFITCLDSTGNFEWVKKSGSIGLDAGSSICTDTSNTIFLAGLFSNSCAFESINMISAGSKDLFVARIDPAGTVNVKENENRETNLVVYPNPTNGLIKVSLKDNTFSKPVQVKFFNAIGELILEKELKNMESEIYLGNYEKGIYFLETNMGNKVLTKKIIIY